MLMKLVNMNKLPAIRRPMNLKLSLGVYEWKFEKLSIYLPNMKLDILCSRLFSINYYGCSCNGASVLKPKTNIEFT